MSVCDDMSKSAALHANHCRLKRLLARKPKEPEPWILLKQIYRLNARREITKRNVLIARLAALTGATWYQQEGVKG